MELPRLQRLGIPNWLSDSKGQNMTYHACPKCKAIVPRFQHLHESAGISGAHLDGTERYVCPGCGYELPPAQALALGLLYTYDRDKNHWPPIPAL